MNRHLPLVQRVHPMLPGGGWEETVCAHCHEAWPCTTTDLLAAAKAALAVGEIRFKTCVLAAQAHEQLAAAINKAEGR